MARVQMFPFVRMRIWYLGRRQKDAGATLLPSRWTNFSHRRIGKKKSFRLLWCDYLTLWALGRPGATEWFCQILLSPPWVIHRSAFLEMANNRAASAMCA